MNVLHSSHVHFQCATLHFLGKFSPKVLQHLKISLARLINETHPEHDPFVLWFSDCIVLADTFVKLITESLVDQLVGLLFCCSLLLTRAYVNHTLRHHVSVLGSSFGVS